jgi:hypothetical protein
MTRLLVGTALALFVAACGGSSKQTPPAEPTPLPGDETAEGGAAYGGAAYGATGAEPEVAASEVDCSKVESMTMPEAETKGLAMMEEMGTLFEQNAEDCKVLAAGLRSWTAKNRGLLERMSCFAKTVTQEQKEQFDQKFAEKMQAIGMKMMPAIQKCQNDDDLMKAMQEIPQ